MKGTRADRLICISATPVAPKREMSRTQRMIARPILYRLFGGDYRDYRRMESLLHASHANWTILRPPRLTNGRPTGHYRTAVNTPPPKARRITRTDLAAAMLDLVDDPIATHATITIAN
jgi:putative NADH-flavin reductase